MAFCTQCGHSNGAEARFCEECGTPLAVKTTPPLPELAAQATFAPAPPPVARGGKGLKIALVAGVMLVAIAVGLFVLLAPQAPSNERFAALIESSLAANSQAYKARYCLGNMPYNLEMVRVNEYDQKTQQWMGLLTQAGLYTAPEIVTNNTGFFTVRQLSYTKTDAGKKATQGRQLCIADGVAVSKVEHFTSPEKLGPLETSSASVTLKLRNPMPWVSSAKAQELAPEITQEFSENFLLVLKDGTWALADAREVLAAKATQHQPDLWGESQASPSGDTGVFASLRKLFGGSVGNPLIGRWKLAGVSGFGLPLFEFDADTMTLEDKTDKVRYQIEGKRVTVYSRRASAGPGMVFNIIDDDTVTVSAGSFGLMTLTLTRIH